MKKIRSVLLILLLIIIIFFTFYNYLKELNQPHNLTTTTSAVTTQFGAGDLMSLHFIDVGQGSATLIQYKDKHILIDAGEEEYGPKVVDYLTQVGVNDLWIVIGTHPDSDHIGGLNHVLDAFDTETVIDSGLIHNTKEYQEYMNSIKTNGSNLILDTEINEKYFYFEEGNHNIYLLVLETGDLNYSDVNNHTVVTLLVYNDIRVFLSGDMEAEAENFLLERVHNQELLENLDSTIYTAAHHGSRTSNSYAILEMLSPEYIIISAGKDNKYKHPHQEVMERYAEYTDQVYITYEVCPTTDLCAITIETNGVEVFVDETPTETLPKLITPDLEFINFFEETKVGSSITVTVKGKPNTLYNIDFYLPSGTLSSSSAFADKISDSNGFVSWTYTVSSSAKVGFGSVVVKDPSGGFIKEVYRFNAK